MLLTDYPIEIGNTTITIPAQSFSVSYDTLENTNTTEDGHDDIELIRNGKTKISLSYKCMSGWAGTFQGLTSALTHSVRYYDPNLQGYVTKTMRLRNFKFGLVKKSDKLAVSNGIYNVSFDLLEF